MIKPDLRDLINRHKLIDRLNNDNNNYNDNNNEANNRYYFTIKIFLELNSFGWLQSKKEAINNNNNFRNALDDVLNYQTIDAHRERLSKLKPCINTCNWEGVEFPAGSKE